MDGLEFNNAIEIGSPPTTPEGELDLDKIGFPAEDLEDTPVVEVTTKSTEPAEEVETISTEPTEPTQSVETVETPDTSYQDYIPNVANFLAEKGYFTELPEGVNADQFDEDAFVKTYEHNLQRERYSAWEQGVKEEQERIVGKLSPIMQKALSYNLQNPNVEDVDIASYIQKISDNSFAQELSVENHADKIVRDYYGKVAGWNPKEVEDKIAGLTASDSLKKEAEILKPKLQTHISGLVKQKEEEARLIAEQTQAINQELGGKVNNLLRGGKLNNIPITREEAGFIQQALLNNEVPVNLRGKKVEMGYAEALVLQQKYQGNLENLALGLLIIKNGPAAIEKFIGKQARTKETEKFIKQTKFSNTKKKSVSTDKHQMYDTGGLNFSL